MGELPYSRPRTVFRFLRGFLVRNYMIKVNPFLVKTMKKGTFLIASFLSVVILSSTFASTMAVSPWVPDPAGVPGWDHPIGSSFTAADAPLLTNVTDIQVDFWTQDGAAVVSITILNDTNIFDQPIPADLKAEIDTYLAQIPGGDSIQMETIWDMLNVALPLIAAFLRLNGNVEMYTMDLADNEYIDAGIAIYTDNMTVAIAKDQELAIITATFPIADIPSDEVDLHVKVNELINEINALVYSGMGDVVVVSEPNAASVDPDGSVLAVLEHISTLYGTNGPEGSGLSTPGYPFAFVTLFSILAMVVLIKKSKK